MKTSKVTHCEYENSYTTSYGELHSFAIKFENGDFGKYSSKSKEQNKFVVGQEADYEIETKKDKNGNGWTKITPAKKDFGKKGFNLEWEKHKQKLIIRQSSLKLALDWLTFHDQKTADTKLLMQYAETFTHYVENGLTPKQ